MKQARAKHIAWRLASIPAGFRELEVSGCSQRGNSGTSVQPKEILGGPSVTVCALA